MPRTKNSKISMIIRISRSYLRSRDMNFNSNSSFVVSYSQSTTDFNLIRKVNEKSGNGIFWSVLNGNDLIQRVVLSSRSSEFTWFMFFVEKRCISMIVIYNLYSVYTYRFYHLDTCPYIEVMNLNFSWSKKSYF